MRTVLDRLLYSRKFWLCITSAVLSIVLYAIWRDPLLIAALQISFAFNIFSIAFEDVGVSIAGDVNAGADFVAMDKTVK